MFRSKMWSKSLSRLPRVPGNFEPPHQVSRYQGRLSGPFLDRLDLLIEVPVIPPRELQDLAPGESSAVVAERVASARERAVARQGVANALLQAQDIATHVTLEPAAKALLSPRVAGGPPRGGPGRRRRHRPGPCGRSDPVAARPAGRHRRLTPQDRTKPFSVRRTSSPTRRPGSARRSKRRVRPSSWRT